MLLHALALALAAGPAAAQTASTSTAEASIEAQPETFLFEGTQTVRLDHLLRFERRWSSPALLTLTVSGPDGRVLDQARESWPTPDEGETFSFGRAVSKPLAPGFYRADLSVEEEGKVLAELRYGFGVSASRLRPGPRRPEGFDRFWKRTLEELAAVPPDASFVPAPESSDAQVLCFRASYASLKGLRVHAWYCRPAGPGPFPGLLINPWYGEGRVEPPREAARLGAAVLWYQGRGYDVDRSSYPPENASYMLQGIDRPETYVYRELAAHAARGLDVLASRPEVDASRLGTGGASQGGGLALLLGGLDPRVKAVAANFPFLSDFGASLPSGGPPYRDVRDELERSPGRREAVLRTLAFFDALNVADRVRARVLIQAGLLDKTCPPEGVLAVYNALRGPKRLSVYPSAGHVGQGAERWSEMLGFLASSLLGEKGADRLP